MSLNELKRPYIYSKWSYIVIFNRREAIFVYILKREIGYDS